jgi:hypothetical protein
VVFFGSTIDLSLYIRFIFKGRVQAKIPNPSRKQPTVVGSGVGVTDMGAYSVTLGDPVLSKTVEVFKPKDWESVCTTSKALVWPIGIELKKKSILFPLVLLFSTAAGIPVAGI